VLDTRRAEDEALKKKPAHDFRFAGGEKTDFTATDVFTTTGVGRCRRGSRGPRARPASQV